MAFLWKLLRLLDLPMRPREDVMAANAVHGQVIWGILTRSSAGRVLKVAFARSK